MRMLLLDAAAVFDEPCVSPVTLLNSIAEFCERDDYEFLKAQPDGPYRDHRAFVDQVKERWLDLVEGGAPRCQRPDRRAEPAQLSSTSYVTHVSHWVKKERVFNPLTGQDEEPDTDLMKTRREEPRERRRAIVPQRAAERHRRLGDRPPRARRRLRVAVPALHRAAPSSLLRRTPYVQIGEIGRAIISRDRRRRHPRRRTSVKSAQQALQDPHRRLRLRAFEREGGARRARSTRATTIDRHRARRAALGSRVGRAELPARRERGAKGMGKRIGRTACSRLGCALCSTQ